MKHTLLFVALFGFAPDLLAQRSLTCTPECKVECGRDQVAICKTKDGQCTTRCLAIPSDLKGNERKAFILSAALEQEVTLDEVGQDEFKTIWRANRAEIDGGTVQFK